MQKTFAEAHAEAQQKAKSILKELIGKIPSPIENLSKNQYTDVTFQYNHDEVYGHLARYVIKHLRGEILDSGKGWSPLVRSKARERGIDLTKSRKDEERIKKNNRWIQASIPEQIACLIEEPQSQKTDRHPLGVKFTSEFEGAIKSIFKTLENHVKEYIDLVSDDSKGGYGNVEGPQSKKMKEVVCSFLQDLTGDTSLTVDSLFFRGVGHNRGSSEPPSDPGKTITSNIDSEESDSVGGEEAKTTKRQKTSQRITQADMVFECLKERPGQEFTARQIAEWIRENYRAESKPGKKTKEEKIKQITNEISARYSRQIKTKYHQLKEVGIGRERRYYYSEESDSGRDKTTENSVTPISNDSTPAPKLTEPDLYKPLHDFLLSELKIYSRRIKENLGSNKPSRGGNKWLYPDLVGMQDLSSEWHDKIKECVQEYQASKKSKLWSFEVKINIERSNVRKFFFQAVSNSSWANFGYLVASEIDDDTIKELLMLSSLHGIGVIRLDSGNPRNSKIFIPAKERVDIDWDMANRLAKESSDFSNYIGLIRQFYRAGEITKDWEWRNESS